jgi:integrase
MTGYDINSRCIWPTSGPEGGGSVAKRSFGSLRRRTNGRWQARYTGPDGRTYSAGVTFDSRQRADAFLARTHGDIQAGRWSPPAAAPASREAPLTLRAYAASWLAGRELSPSTRRLYRVTLANQVLPAFGDVPLTAITPAAVREWYAAMGTGGSAETGPTQRAHAYGLLRTILGTAVTDDVIPANPCRVRGGGSSRRVKQIRAATLPELAALAEAMPPRFRLMVLLAAWCALRFGELAELRRADLDVKAGIVHVRRGLIRSDAGREVKGPKSEAGKRDVTIPPHLLPLVKTHLREHVAADRGALVFPAASGGHLDPGSLYRAYYPARIAAGRPDLRFHDLRHTGAVLAAATGATLAELMARLGHSTVSAAMRYQHAAADRDRAIAAALSELAGGPVTPITRAKSSQRRKGGTG